MATHIYYDTQHTTVTDAEISDATTLSFFYFKQKTTPPRVVFCFINHPNWGVQNIDI